MDWEYLDIAGILEDRLDEYAGATTSGNVGAFERQLGPMIQHYPLPGYVEIDDPFSASFDKHRK